MRNPMTSPFAFVLLMTSVGINPVVSECAPCISNTLPSGEFVRVALIASLTSSPYIEGIEPSAISGWHVGPA